jgi:uncharacterized membrane protein YphA (DoxX/SURF4 family)
MRFANVWTQVTTGIALWLLAAFFLFVGFMKMLAPMAMLQLHHAWVADLPPVAARLIGVSEILCSLVLLLGLGFSRFVWPAAVAALLLLVNQMVAVAFHAARGELEISGLQNAVLVAALALIAFQYACNRKNQVRCLNCCGAAIPGADAVCTE